VGTSAGTSNSSDLGSGCSGERYACGAYALILEHAPRLRDRADLAAEQAAKVRVSDGRVDPTEVNDILAAARAARNRSGNAWRGQPYRRKLRGRTMPLWRLLFVRCRP
jgi:hypothetical protein